MVQILLYLILILTIYNFFQRKSGKNNAYENSEKQWLNEFIDSYVAITIPKRKAHVKKFYKSFQLKPHIFNAVLKENIKYNNEHGLKIGEIACALSQEKALKEFVEKGTNHLLMLEDDNILYGDAFYSEIGFSLDQIKKYMKDSFTSLPSDWDVLYYGRCWDDCESHVKVNKYIAKTNKTLCHHAIVFSRKGAIKVLEQIKHPIKEPIDHIVGNMCKRNELNSYATIIPVFYQSRDEIISAVGNYDHLPVCK